MIWTKHRKDVLRGIYQLEGGGQTLRQGELGFALGFNQSSVERTVSYLAESGYVIKQRVKGFVVLSCTDSGREEAQANCAPVKTRAFPDRTRSTTHRQSIRFTRFGLKVSEERYLKIMEDVDYSADNIKREVLAGGIPHRELTHSGCGSSLGGV